MLTTRTRKSNWLTFLDPTKENNETLRYQRDADSLFASNGAWLLKLPWALIPVAHVGPFPNVEPTATTYRDGFPSHSGADVDLAQFLADGVRTAGTPLEQSDMIWSPDADRRARLFRTVDPGQFWFGIDERYLTALLGLYPDATFRGSKPDDAAAIYDGDEPVGLIMPIRTPDPSEAFTSAS